MSAGQIVDRIKRQIGVEWQAATEDRFIVGDPGATVTGVAVSVWPTLDVLNRAASGGSNLLITHEPTFWTDEDEPSAFPDDGVAAAKLRVITENELVVFRLHEHWHLRQPDPFWTCLGRALGWEEYERTPENQPGRSTSNPWLKHHFRQPTYQLPPTSLERLAQDVQRKLPAPSLRVIGDRQLTVGRIALSPGFCPLEWAIDGLSLADVLILGECREWEGVEYARDLVRRGIRKGMIVLGHAVGEEPGMECCAEWLREVVPDVPVEYIAAGSPYWHPDPAPIEGSV
ncbi:MAG TPA: Nif3-like dinuclear metal center hexameric protein [Solirubrobacterales bacterium]|nr:Nif3-like dinuclear metal center hexameric protein [Solirubrobacterales bacterium]